MSELHYDSCSIIEEKDICDLSPVETSWKEYWRERKNESFKRYNMLNFRFLKKCVQTLYVTTWSMSRKSGSSKEVCVADCLTQ